MSIIRKQIIVKKGNEYMVRQLFLDNFRIDRSPILPIFISYKAAYYKTENPLDYYYDWGISLKPKENQINIIELARIHFSDSPKGLVINFTYEDVNNKYVTQFISFFRKFSKNFGFFVLKDVEEKSEGGDHIPTTEKAFARWVRIYEICTNLREEYLNDWKDSFKNKSEPLLEDYLDAIKGELGKDISEKTLRRILKAGDEGKLE